MAATVPLEAAAVMQPDDAPEPAVLDEYRELLPAGLPVEVVERMAFYELTAGPMCTSPSPPATSGCMPTSC